MYNGGATVIAVICAAIEDPSDREFMEQLFSDFERTMFSVARKYVSNPTDQEDLVQESAIKLIEKISTIRSMNRCILASYIVFTIRNTSIDFLRNQQVKQSKVSSMEDETFFEPESPSLPLDDQLISAEYLSELWTYLSEEDRTLFEGKYLLGNTDEELAVRLKCQPDSIRMKLTRARRKALKLLTDGKEGAVL